MKAWSGSWMCLESIPPRTCSFTLDTVRCLGTCAMAPVVMIDEEYLGEANIRSLKKELKKL